MKTILRYILSWMIMLALAFSVTTCYDDTEVLDLLSNHEARLAELEKTCSQINTNISSLQTILNALQNNDYITSIAPISEGGVVVGYTLSFGKSGDVTIYHGSNGADGKDGADGTDGRDGNDGRNGEDGAVPVIGVAQAEDGLWYWTVNGEWLLDSDGEKVKAVGTDGTNGENGTAGSEGVTPQMKIEDGYWYVSSDNGATWTKLGKAVGENGKDGKDGRDGTNGNNVVDGNNGSDGANGNNGDPMFSSITQDSEYVYIKLASGTVLTLARAEQLSVTFSEGDIVTMSSKSQLDIHYNVTTPSNNVMVEVTTSNDIKANVIPDEDPHTGVIRVETGTVIDENTKVIVFVSNQTQTLMYTFSFEEAGLAISGDAVVATLFTGNTIELYYLANIECLATVTQGSDWLHIVSTKAITRHTVTLSADPNPGKTRIGKVQVSDKDGLHVVEYTVTQTGPGEPIVFKDENLKDVLIDNGVDTDGDGEISYVEAAAVTSLESAFGEMLFDGNNTPASSFTGFDEFQFFTGVTAIPNGSFNKWQSMGSITIPESIETVGNNVLRSCYSLATINGKFATADHNALIAGDRFVRLRFNIGDGSYTVPEGVTTIASYAFSECCISSLSLPSTLTHIGSYAFYYCDITSLTIPSNVTYEENSFFLAYAISNYYGQGATNDSRALIQDGCMMAFAIGSGITDYEIPKGVTRLSSYLFTYYDILQSVTIPASVTSVGNYTFFGCSALTELSFLGTVVPEIGASSFYNTNDCPIYVPTSAYKAYISSNDWAPYADRLVPDTEVWTVIGSFCAWEPDDEIEMEKISEGKWALIVDWSAVASPEFKIRKNYSWDYNYGGTLISLDTPFEAVQGGPNVVPPAAGKYRIVLDLTNSNGPTITVEAAVDVSTPGGSEGIGYENW